MPTVMCKINRDNIMQSKSESEDSELEKKGSIIDSTGKPFKQPIKWIDRWKTLSSKIKIIAISIAAFITIFATLLTNIDKIEKFFQNEKVSTSVPQIIVKLKNNSDREIIVSARGDFILWLPGPGTHHTMGKYEFLTILTSQGISPISGSITIPSKDTVTVFAQVMNEKFYSKILSQADCDLSLMVYRSGAGLISTNNIPFTETAIKKYYIEADVGKQTK